MQQVFALRKIILIFGFILVFIGCTMNKDFDETKEVLAVKYTYSTNGELLTKSEYK